MASCAAVIVGSFFATEICSRFLSRSGSSADGNGKSKKALYAALAMIVALTALTIGYAGQYKEPNLYSIHGVGRHSTPLQIRKAFKEMSVKLHPDKNNNSPEAATKFDELKKANDVLMESDLRDIYNRFGQNQLSFDPRNDELQLIINLALSYMLWGLVTVLVTLSPSTKACRLWVSILCLVMLGLEASFYLTEMALPKWFPKTMTEFEFITSIHLFFPTVLMCLRAVAISYFFDLDAYTSRTLDELQEQNKAIVGVLHQVQVEVNAVLLKDKSADEKAVATKLNELHSHLTTSSARTDQLMSKLKGAMKRNDRVNYVGILIVLFYLVSFYFQ